MIRTILCATLLFCAVAPAAVEDEIRAAEQRWAEALKTRDTAALEKLYTPGLIYTHATGIIENKAQYIERLRSGKQRYEGVDFESTKIVSYGSSVVSHSIARTRGTNDRGAFNDHIVMTHVWVKQGNEWRLAAHHTTKLP